MHILKLFMIAGLLMISGASIAEEIHRFELPARKKKDISKKSVALERISADTKQEWNHLLGILEIDRSQIQDSLSRGLIRFGGGKKGLIRAMGIEAVSWPQGKQNMRTLTLALNEYYVELSCFKLFSASQKELIEHIVEQDYRKCVEQFEILVEQIPEGKRVGKSLMDFFDNQFPEYRYQAGIFIFDRESYDKLDFLPGQRRKINSGPYRGMEGFVVYKRGILKYYVIEGEFDETGNVEKHTYALTLDTKRHEDLKNSIMLPSPYIIGGIIKRERLDRQSGKWIEISSDGFELVGDDLKPTKSE